MSGAIFGFLERKVVEGIGKLWTMHCFNWIASAIKKWWFRVCLVFFFFKLCQICMYLALFRLVFRSVHSICHSLSLEIHIPDDEVSCWYFLFKRLSSGSLL